MTCNNYGEPNHNITGCKKLPVQAKPMKSKKLIDEPEEIKRTTPESSQASQDMNFMPTPTLRQHAPQFSGPRPCISRHGPDFEFPESSRQRSSKPDATMVQQTVHPDLTITFPNHDPAPSIRPRIASESTLFQASNMDNFLQGRIINFIGDRNGVSVLSNLPYSPTTLTWKGKVVVTQGQLETQSRRRIEKLKPRKEQK